MALASMVIKIGADISKFEKNIRKIERNLGRTAKTINKAGKELTTAITLPAMAAGGAAIKLAGDFEQSLNKVSTIADTSVKPIGEIEKEVLALSNKVGIAGKELNETLYQAISATGDTANAMSYVEIASKAAIGGFTDAATAVDGLTTVLNAYGLQGTKAMQKVSDQMLMAQNFGKTTFGEMASSIGNVIPIAASLNVTTEELFASIATLTKNGVQTSQAITGLKAAYSNILKPSKQASELAEKLGINFNSAYLQSVGWAKFLEEIKDKANGNAEAMATLFGSVEGLNAVTVLAGKGSRDFADALTAMGQSAGATNEAFMIMDKGLNDSISDTIIKLQNLGITIGDMLVPYINMAIDKVSQMVTWFSNLDSGTQENIVKFIALSAALGPVLLGIGKLITLGSSLVGVFGRVVGSTGTLITTFGNGLNFVKAGFETVYLNGLYAVDAIKAFGNNLVIGAQMAVQFGANLIQTGVSAVISFTQSLLTSAATAISTFISSIVSATAAAWGFFAALMANPITWVVMAIVGLIAAIIAIWKNWDQVSAWLMKSWETIKNVASNTFNGVKNAIISAFEAVKSAVLSIWDGIVSGIKGAINFIIKGINKLISGMNKVSFSVPSWVPGIGGKSFGFNIPQIPMLATGGIVTKPTLAMIGEAGPEAVVPLNKYNEVNRGFNIIQVILDGRVIQEYVDNSLGNSTLRMA